MQALQTKKICGWHGMERCILDIVLSHISHLYNFLCHSICSHSDYTPSLNNHTKLVFGASPAVFTHPDCNDPAPHAQPSPRIAHGFLCHTRELQGLGQPSDHPGSFHSGSVPGANPPVYMCWEDQCQMSSTGHIWAPSELPFTGLLSAWLMCLVSKQLWSCP